MKKVLVILGLIALTSCTEQNMAKSWGGTAHIDLEPGERLVNVTWKETSLWYLTKQDPNQAPTTYQFKEQSSWNIKSGVVIIKEK